jgi:hypothetical protein
MAGHDVDRMIVVRFIFRFLIVPFAASVAICVAMLFVVAAHWNRFVALAGNNPAPPDDAAYFLLLLAPALVMSAAVVAMLAPAAIGALIAEAFAIRSWMFHIANGGLSAWIGWLTLEDVRKPYEIFNEPLIVAGAGIAAGFAYWAIAGWSAGFWKPMFDQPAKENRLSEERR